MPFNRPAGVSKRRQPRSTPWLIVALLCAAGCAPTPPGETLETTRASPEVHWQAGVAILTPTAASGHEEDRQMVALTFAKTLAALRPELATIPLPRTLSAINAAGLGDAYRQMYAAYRETGIFDAAVLRKIGPAVGARYLLQLKLAAFDQNSSGGIVTVLGVNLLRQQTAELRLLAQLWDSADGSLVWERSDEASKRRRSLIRTRTIPMEDLLDAAAEDVVKQLPGGFSKSAPISETALVRTNRRDTP